MSCLLHHAYAWILCCVVPLIGMNQLAQAANLTSNHDIFSVYKNSNFTCDKLRDTSMTASAAIGPVFWKDHEKRQHHFWRGVFYNQPEQRLPCTHHWFTNDWQHESGRTVRTHSDPGKAFSIYVGFTLAIRNIKCVESASNKFCAIVESTVWVKHLFVDSLTWCSQS